MHNIDICDPARCANDIPSDFLRAKSAHPKRLLDKYLQDLLLLVLPDDPLSDVNAPRRGVR